MRIFRIKGLTKAIVLASTILVFATFPNAQNDQGNQNTAVRLKVE